MLGALRFAAARMSLVAVLFDLHEMTRAMAARQRSKGRWGEEEQRERRLLVSD